MPFDMYGDVILTRDVTERGLRTGDVGTVVERHAVSSKDTLTDDRSSGDAMTRKRVDRTRLLAFLSALLFSLAPKTMGQDVAASRKADREQLTAIIDKWEKAWNSHDMHAFASLFHEDGVWILWTGDVWKGRKAIEEGHAAVHRTVFRNSIQRERLEELTFVGSDTAVVRFYSTLTGDERAPGKTIRSRKILIVTKRAGAWKVGWGQNTRLADSTPE